MDIRYIFQDLFLLLFLLDCYSGLILIEDDYDDAASFGRCPWIRNKLKNGRVRYRYKGRVAKFLCDSGYDLAGKRSSTCVRGQWSNPVPVCVARGCSRVPMISNGHVTELYRGALLVYDCNPGYTLDGVASIHCDGRRWSTSPPACVVAYENPDISCDFENPDLCGWSHDANHDFDWKRNQFSTPSGHAGTGPSFDHTFGENKGGYYLYIEASSPRKVNDTARLFSPVYPAGMSGGCFLFWYHMYGATTGGLKVYLKPESHVFDELLPKWEKYGDQGNEWNRGNITIPLLHENFQIVIEGIRGESYVGDSAIDDVSLTTQDCGSVENDTGIIENTNADSCRGRCREGRNADSGSSCGCNDNCYSEHNCCSDYVTFCFEGNETTLPNTDETSSTFSSKTTPITSTATVLTPETPEQRTTVPNPTSQSKASYSKFTLPRVILPVTVSSTPSTSTSSSIVSSNVTTTSTAFLNTTSTPSSSSTQTTTIAGTETTAAVTTALSSKLTSSSSISTRTTESSTVAITTTVRSTARTTTSSTTSTTISPTDSTTISSTTSTSTPSVPITLTSAMPKTFASTRPIASASTERATSPTTFSATISTTLIPTFGLTSFPTSIMSSPLPSTTIHVKSTTTSSGPISASSITTEPSTRKTYNLRPRTQRTTIPVFSVTYRSTEIATQKVTYSTVPPTVISVAPYTSSKDVMASTGIRNRTTTEIKSSITMYPTMWHNPVTYTSITPITSTRTRQYSTTFSTTKAIDFASTSRQYTRQTTERYTPRRYRFTSIQTSSPYATTSDSYEMVTPKAETTTSDSSTPVVISTLVVIVCIVAVAAYYMRKRKNKRQSKLSDDSEMRFLQENEYMEYSDASALDRILIK